MEVVTRTYTPAHALMIAAVNVTMAVARLATKHPLRDRFTTSEVASVIAYAAEHGKGVTKIAHTYVEDVVLGARYAYEAGWLLDVRALGFSDMMEDTPVGRPTWRGLNEAHGFFTRETTMDGLGEIIKTIERGSQPPAEELKA
ncbi:MAG: hypothetical protein M0027_16465 [Candidatus Dormibacteraeota bacterium]|nr:hypothetical protein [Candidatus Dormibacteraeota bacterium]